MEKTILAIDDDPGYRETIHFALSDQGYRILSASSGQEALGILRREKVELVITDMKMPKMDGLDTVIAIKKMQPAMRITLITGASMEDQVKNALALKATTCLRKPFNIDALMEIVNSVFYPGASGTPNQSRLIDSF